MWIIYRVSTRGILCFGSKEVKFTDALEPDIPMYVSNKKGVGWVDSSEENGC